MRNFIVAKLKCARCGEPLEIKFPNEVSEDTMHHSSCLNDGLTGAAKFDASIFVEPCRYCQDKLERPARMILEGINKLQAEGGGK